MNLKNSYPHLIPSPPSRAAANRQLRKFLSHHALAEPPLPTALRSARRHSARRPTPIVRCRWRPLRPRRLSSPLVADTPLYVVVDASAAATSEPPLIDPGQSYPQIVSLRRPRLTGSPAPACAPHAIALRWPTSSASLTVAEVIFFIKFTSNLSKFICNLNKFD
jgi:hypothetical protein